MNIIIEPINLEDVLNDVNKKKFNSNNHWIDDIKPENYDKTLNNCNTSKWIDKFHTSYNVININTSDINWMKLATDIGIITRTFSKKYEEEKQEMCEKFNDIEYLFKFNKYFIRTENVSLKYGIYGIGPYTSFNNVIESLCTCSKGHSPITSNTKSLKIFLMKWIDMDYMSEFRVFVYKNKITAISQQHLYFKNDLYEKDKSLINKHIDIIVRYYENTIKNKIDYMDSYTYDFSILKNDKPYLIEFNSFGKEYAAGSALFHWLIDEEKLYNQTNDIYFRYTF